jgi:3-methylfumaryl-CoA hydratase
VGDDAAPAAPDGADGDGWRVETSPALLFRYSAITFNGHRIHYDLPYATGAEGYPGLVVHGPIQATLLLNRATAALGRPPARFDYRGLAPAFAGTTIRVRQAPGEAARFRVEGPDGTVHMEAAVGEPGGG